MEKVFRSSANKWLLSLYAVLYVALPIAMMFWLYIVYLPTDRMWFDTVGRYSVWGGILLYASISYYFFQYTFPKKNSEALVLFVPFIINYIFLFFVTRDSVFSHHLFVTSVTVYIGMLISFALRALSDPWIDEYRDTQTLISSIRNKLRYIRQFPIILLGIVVLCIPVVNAIHAAWVAYELQGDISLSVLSRFQLFFFLFLIADVVVIHYTKMKKVPITF